MIFTTLIGATLFVVPGLFDPFLASKGLFLMLAVALWLGITFVQRGSIPAPSLKLVVLWSGAGVLSWLTSADSFAAMQFWALGLAVIVFCSGNREVSEKQIFFLVAGLGLVQVGAGVAQTLLVGKPSTFAEFPVRLKFAGTLGNPQYVASFLGLGVCLALFAEKKKWFHWAIALVFAFGMAMTRVQGTAFCLLATLLWFAPLSRRQRGFVAGVALVVLLALSSYWHWHTFRGRMLLSSAALKMVIDSFGVGVGLGQFGNHLLSTQRELLSWISFAGFQENAGFADHPHNEYLALIAELGVLGLALIAWTISQLRRIKPSLAITVLLTFTALDAFFSFPWRLLPIALVVGLLIAREFSVRRNWDGVRLAMLSGLFFFISLTGIAVQYGEGRADRLARQGRIPQAEETVDWVLRLAPHRPELNLLKGRLRYFQFDAPGALFWAERANSYGERIDSLKLQGLALMELKRLDDAETLYHRLAATLPNQITAHYYLGEIYTRQGRFEEARREFALLPSRRPKNAKAVIDLWRARDFL